MGIPSAEMILVLLLAGMFLTLIAMLVYTLYKFRECLERIVEALRTQQTSINNIRASIDSQRKINDEFRRFMKVVIEDRVHDKSL